MNRQKCWWSQLQPQPEHSLLEQAPLLIAGPFSLSSIHTLAALLGCCALSSILPCWHSTGFSLIMSPCLTLPSWLHLDHLHCVTRGRCFLPLCPLLKGLPQVDWLLVHFHLPASLCLSMNRSKKYSPGFMLCWLNQSEQTTLGHLFLGLDPN